MESKVVFLNPERNEKAPPILSFQFTAICGPKSSGKSYTSMQIYKQFLEECKEDVYDF